MSPAASRLFAAVVTAIALAATVWGLSLVEGDDRDRAGPERAKRGPVPRLIGLTPVEAQRRLQPLGLGTAFAQRCEGRQPRGRVIAQAPRAGRRTNERRVQLQTDWSAACSARTLPVACAPDDLSLQVVAREPAVGGGDVVVAMVVENRGAGACQLEAEGSLALTQTGGTAPDIRGVPARVSLDVALAAGGSLRGRWSWTNWCGTEGGWQVRAELAELAAEADTGAPECMDSARASLLFGGEVATSRPGGG